MILTLEVDPDLRGETTGFWSHKVSRLRYFRDRHGHEFENMVYEALRASWQKPPISDPLDVLLVYYFKARANTIAYRPFMTYAPTISDLNGSLLRVMERVCMTSQNQVVSALGRKEWTRGSPQIEVFINPLSDRSEAPHDRP